MWVRSKPTKTKWLRGSKKHLNLPFRTPNATTKLPASRRSLTASYKLCWKIFKPSSKRLRIRSNNSIKRISPSENKLLKCKAALTSWRGRSMKKKWAKEQLRRGGKRKISVLKNNLSRQKRKLKKRKELLIRWTPKWDNWKEI